MWLPLQQLQMQLLRCFWSPGWLDAWIDSIGWMDGWMVLVTSPAATMIPLMVASGFLSGPKPPVKPMQVEKRPSQRVRWSPV
jgi:hypothetical protein